MGSNICLLSLTRSGGGHFESRRGDGRGLVVLATPPGQITAGNLIGISFHVLLPARSLFDDGRESFSRSDASERAEFGRLNRKEL
jgi:hypothetical protein